MTFSPSDLFRFDGQTAVVLGGSSGIGAAAKSILEALGARVTVMDRTPVSGSFIEVDLRSERSIDLAVTSIESKVDVLLCCAGINSQADGIHQVNFLGQRHLIATLLATSHLASGSAIGVISSIAGRGWEKHSSLMDEYLDTTTFVEGSEWIAKHSDNPAVNAKTSDYQWSKRAICAYVARSSSELLGQGVRINAVLPGITDTPLARANGWLARDAEWRSAYGLEAATPDKPAYPLVFLCSRAASQVNGAHLVVDGGFEASQLETHQGV